MRKKFILLLLAATCSSVSSSEQSPLACKDEVSVKHITWREIENGHHDTRTTQTNVLEMVSPATMALKIRMKAGTVQFDIDINFGRDSLSQVTETACRAYSISNDLCGSIASELRTLRSWILMSTDSTVAMRRAWRHVQSVQTWIEDENGVKISAGRYSKTTYMIMPPPVREVTLSGLRRASGITADDMERRVIAIVVPYRDRASHLTEFLSYMTRVLGMNSRIRSEQCESIQERSSSLISGFDGSSGKSSIEFEIIIVEQDNALPFNRGWLMNVGYHLATSNRFIGEEGKSWSPADVVIFHDIDILPSGEMVMFYATPPPVHNALHMVNPMWPKGPRLMFSYYGGINSFRSEDFLSINGFPNDLFGWGLEDDCLRQRAALRTPYPLEILRPLHGHFSFLPHTSNRNDSTLTSYVDVLRKDAKTWRSNGLSSLKYSIRDIQYVSSRAIHVKVDSLFPGG